MRHKASQALIYIAFMWNLLHKGFYSIKLETRLGSYKDQLKKLFKPNEVMKERFLKHEKAKQNDEKSRNMSTYSSYDHFPHNFYNHI